MKLHGYLVRYGPLPCRMPNKLRKIIDEDDMRFFSKLQLLYGRRGLPPNIGLKFERSSSSNSSYCSLREFIDLKMDTITKVRFTYKAKDPYMNLCGISDDSIDAFQIVFWFDLG